MCFSFVAFPLVFQVLISGSDTGNYDVAFPDRFIIIPLFRSSQRIGECRYKAVAPLGHHSIGDIAYVMGFIACRSQKRIICIIVSHVIPDCTVTTVEVASEKFLIFEYLVKFQSSVRIIFDRRCSRMRLPPMRPSAIYDNLYLFILLILYLFRN